MTRQRLSFVALLLVALVAGLAAQSQTPKRMMGGQLVLEDQGSFFVGGVAKKIEKTYYEMWRTEAAEVAANKEKERILAGVPASSSSSKQEEKAPELRIGDQNSQMADERRSGALWVDAAVVCTQRAALGC